MMNVYEQIIDLNEERLYALKVGAAVLGSGGGGDPRYDWLMAKRAVQEYGAIRVIQLNALKDDDYVLPLSFMGAPLVGMEKISDGEELLTLVEKTEQLAGKKVTALCCAEIGGGNAFAPMLVAGRLGLPVVDADEIGRAFPELQMSSVVLAGLSTGPAILADSSRSTVVIDAATPLEIERLARAVTVAMGSMAALALHAMSGQTARKALIGGSISRAVSIGNVICEARVPGTDPIQTLVSMENGVVLARGSIVDVDHVISDGFLRGSVTVQGESLTTVVYQNEYLLVTVDGVHEAMTPDIIIVLEDETAVSIPTDRLRHGLRVSVVALPSPPIWKTWPGLQLVGPRAFGFDCDYQQFETR